MKISFSCLLFILLAFSCAKSSWKDDELKNSSKASSASSRVNESQSNSNKILKELDE